VKLAASSEKKADLQAQLQQERRTNNRLRSTLSETERKELESKRELNYFETVLNKYEQRNYDLEEREVELRHRLEMLEDVLPVLIMWNVWGLMHDTGNSRVDVKDDVSSALVKVSNENHGDSTENRGQDTSLQLSATSHSTYCDIEQSYRLRAVKLKHQRLLAELHEAEITRPTAEELLWSRLQFLEAQTGLTDTETQESEDTYKKIISELEKEMYSLKNGSQPRNKATNPELEARAETELSDSQFIRCKNVECTKRLQELLQSEADMTKRIGELEMKERAYMETLQKADELWSDMENSYEKRIFKAEEGEALLVKKVRKLEENETKLRQALQCEEENEMLLEKVQNMEENEKMCMERIRVLQTEKDQLIDEIGELLEALQTVQNELDGTKRTVAGPLKEELMKERKKSKTLQNEITKMESELREKSDAQQVQVGT
jgi:hypothetical protein